ncbi:MAG TPA: hypothetical protein VFQ43_04835 [Nitrososphaera sp.]|nr:hypothetical protein [Nitrososphaera sp.]
MNAENENCSLDQPQRIDSGIALCALASAASYIAASPGAGSSGDGSGEAFALAFKALLEWGEAHGLIHPESAFAFLQRPPDAHGDEHEAWFDEPSNRWQKATYSNRFGLAWGRDGTATAGEYLHRLLLQNQYFADDIQLVALVNSKGKLRILISQPHIAGDPAPSFEIKQWFIDLGFVCLTFGERIAWYRARENLLIADAHEGNIIKSQNGVLVPIDLNIVQPVGQLLQSVRTRIEADSATAEI